MSEHIPGRFVFIPEDGNEAYEIDLDAILGDAAERIALTRWERVKAFFQSFKKASADGLVEHITAEPQKVSLPQMVCDKLEELFSTAEWYARDGNSSCYILDVYPRNHATGYEPMVRVAFLGGTAHELTVADLLTDYVPMEPAKKEMH
jgi:hypothetical protein